MSINQLLGYRDIQLSYLEVKHSTHWQVKRNKRALLHIFLQKKEVTRSYFCPECKGELCFIALNCTIQKYH